MLGRGVEQVLDPGRIECLRCQVPLPAAPAPGAFPDLDLGAGYHPARPHRLDAVATASRCEQHPPKAPRGAAASHAGQLGPVTRGVRDQQLRQVATSRDRQDLQLLARPRHERCGPDTNLIPLAASGCGPCPVGACQYEQQQREGEHKVRDVTRRDRSGIAWGLDRVFGKLHHQSVLAEQKLDRQKKNKKGNKGCPLRHYSLSSHLKPLRLMLITLPFSSSSRRLISS